MVHARLPAAVSVRSRNAPLHNYLHLCTLVYGVFYLQLALEHLLHASEMLIEHAHHARAFWENESKRMSPHGFRAESFRLGQSAINNLKGRRAQTTMLGVYTILGGML